MIRMKITFWERNRVVQVRVPYQGTYLRMSTKIKVPEHIVFYESKQLFAGSSIEVVSLNSEITRHRVFIQQVLASGYDLRKEYEAFLRPLDGVYVEDEQFDLYSLGCRYLQEATSGKIKKKSGARIKPSTIHTYRGPVAHLHDFANLNGKLDIMNYNLAHITDLSQKRRVADEWENYFNKFIEYLTRIGLVLNTKSAVLNIIGIVIRHYAAKYFLILPETPKMAPSLNPIVVLEPEFMWKFIADGRYDKLEGEQRFTWEICATIMATSMRISDVASIKWQHMTERPDGLFMSKLNIKTSEPTYTMIPPKLANIFRENMARHGDIYCMRPTNGIDRVYKNITNLFAKYPELHRSVSMSKIDARGEPYLVTKMLYEWVTPHMLRKTAITAMMVDGRSDDFIRLHSGHSRRGNTLERYKGFVQSHYNQEMNTYASRFAE